MARWTRQARLTRREQFEAVLSHGGARTGRYFAVRALASASPQGRLGIVAARRALPRAVDRNRSKRVVREAFREHRALVTGLDIVVICRQALPRRGSTAVREELERLLRAAASLRPAPAPPTPGEKV